MYLLYYKPETERGRHMEQIGMELPTIWFFSHAFIYIYLEFVSRSTGKGDTSFKQTAIWYLVCGILSTGLLTLYAGMPRFIPVVSACFATVVVLFFEGTQLLAWCQTMYTFELPRQRRRSGVSYSILMYFFEIGGATFTLTAIISNLIQFIGIYAAKLLR